MSETLDHFYIVILAGGGGSRLWPKSRTVRPKQFLKLAGDKTLLRETYERLSPLAPSDHFFVTTIAQYRDEVLEEIPEIKIENILIEPSAKSTAIAIGMATAVINKRDPEAVIGTFASDHTIKIPDRFRTVIEAAAQTCTKGNYLVTIGISPTRPHTGYGYIHFSDNLFEIEGEPVYKVLKFVEKPDLGMAEAYIASGNYLWNASYFLFRSGVMLEAFASHMPHLVPSLTKIAKMWGTDSWQAVITDIYKTLKEEPIEYGIFEQANNIVVLRGDFEWSDVGDWSVIYELMEKTKNGNVVVGQEDQVIPIDTRDSLIFGNGKLVAAIGLEDFVVIDSPQALLICPMVRTQEVRKVVEELKRQKRLDLL